MGCCSVPGGVKVTETSHEFSHLSDYSYYSYWLSTLSFFLQSVIFTQYEVYHGQYFSVNIRFWFTGSMLLAQLLTFI